jgi:mannose-1-phosphate guanylyltransferase
MRALLLAAGLGTRLRPLTDVTPKCLAPIKGRPLLDIWLERLSAAGIGPYLINTHYLASQVVEYVESSKYKCLVTLVHEPMLTGTAGTLIGNMGFFQEKDGMLIHADNYCLADFAAFWQAHLDRPSECKMTMMTFRTQTPSTCGIVELDQRGVVTGFYEKVPNPPGNLANGAVYMIAAEAIRKIGIEMKNVSDFSTEVLPHFVGRIYTYETSQTFIDIGSPEAYAEAQCK